MPGTDVAQTCRMVFGELPDLPFLPELPDRGPGADMTGRAAALLVSMPVEITTRGWKLAVTAGRETSLAAGYWSQDLDTLEEVAEGFAGALKVQVCGPITLAATLELTRSLDPALSDQGALADLTDSLAEGVAAHVADVRKRVPGATVILQLDEPALPAALAGRVRTASGLNVVRALEPVIASQRLSTVLPAWAGKRAPSCTAARGTSRSPSSPRPVLRASDSTSACWAMRMSTRSPSSPRRGLACWPARSRPRPRSGS
jgi:hypothetical protein